MNYNLDFSHIRHGNGTAGILMIFHLIEIIENIYYVQIAIIWIITF